MEKSVIFTLQNVLFRGFLDEEEDWKKAKRCRGWRAYEEEYGMRARKKGGEGEEIRGEKM